MAIYVQDTRKREEKGRRKSYLERCVFVCVCVVWEFIVWHGKAGRRVHCVIRKRTW